MFRKLKNQFKIDYKVGEKQISYGDVITYYDVQLVADDVINVIPERYRKDFYLSFMQIVGEVPPHTDSEIKVTINFYVEPGRYITNFFRVKEDAKTSQVENQTNGVIFDREDLQICGSFSTTADHAWVLDVTQPHSVEALKGGITRRSAICLATNKYSYDEVSKMLWEMGY